MSEIPFSLAAALLVGFLANAHLFSTDHELSISRLDGGILLFFFMLFMLYVYKDSVSESHVEEAHYQDGQMSKQRSIVYITLGTVCLYFGGGWVVEGAVAFAHSWGVDDALIGLTIVAIGTSSPELVAS